MGLISGLFGSNSDELKKLSEELKTVNARCRSLEQEAAELKSKSIEIVDKTHGFMDHLKILVSTLDDTHVVERCWALLNQALNIKLGAIYYRTDNGFKAKIDTGFVQKPPIIPLDEESMVGFAARDGSALSLERVRAQDDLAYLEKRGVLQNAKLVCPARVRGNVELLIVVCEYGGNVFDSESDLDLIQMVGTLLGLVMTNALILAEQKNILNKQKKELARVRELFSSMVAPEVIEFIEKNPEGIVLGGKRQPVAIMFADIRNFTTLSEEHTPEKIIELLNNFFSLITDIVIQTKGTLDKFMGDCAMALFGTPAGLKNPSLTAVKAAIQIQRQLAINMKIWQQDGFPKFGVGIGINFQNVVVGNVGSTRLSNFTAIGDGVNLAQRLCGIAEAGEILITTSCYKALGSSTLPVNMKQGIKVKGKSEPITVFSIMDVQPRIIKCPVCQASIGNQKRFCGKCGHQL